MKARQDLWNIFKSRGKGGSHKLTNEGAPQEIFEIGNIQKTHIAMLF